MSGLAKHGQVKQVPQMNEVGNIEDKVEGKNSTETNIENNTKQKPASELEALLESVISSPNKKEKVQRSVYLDKDVCRAFDKFGKNNPRKKSDLVNEFLRRTLLGE